MITFTQTTTHIEETKTPELRNLLNVLARDEGFDNISWYQEDNEGEIEIGIYPDFTKHLDALVDDLKDEFDEHEEKNVCIGDFERKDLKTLNEFTELIKGLDKETSIVSYDTY